ncbi:type II toxin-antitoxin system VapC family toxin [Bacillus subtilis]|uniref:type II toxin-antitoxin system VapC family toxin n=1 Tax=Bacillus subtilis TaxID=1423 RepID=UPI00214A4973|nr:type II toxin-antitoxin system VapC family toxin [Bacillus subtilis]MCR1994609.1 type II toxin-antitoxin system VapC family toxin [Bacillus subtilis]
MLLLDTNHCSGIIGENPDVKAELQKCDYERLCTSFISEAEMYFAAYRSERCIENLYNVEAFLSAMKIYTCDAKISKTYGELKSKILFHFGPNERNKRRKYTLQKAGIGENDLWIASVAIAHDMTVLSCDRDFKRIQEVEPNLKVESWIKQTPIVSEETVTSDV